MLVMPTDLEKYKYCVKLEILDAPLIFSNYTVEENIFLPLPDNIVEPNTTSYEIESVMRRGKDAVDKVLGDNKYNKALSSGVTSDLIDGMAMAGRASVNPANIIRINAPSFRTFKFTFTLSPSMPAESATISRIVKALRAAKSPEVWNNIAITYPKLIRPIFMFDGKICAFLPKIKPCYITSFDVSYGAYTKKGTPSLVTIDIDLTEESIITKGDVEDESY